MKLSLDVNCCSKLIFDQISGISFKKWSVMFKPLIVSIFVNVASERKAVAKFFKSFKSLITLTILYVEECQTTTR